VLLTATMGRADQSLSELEEKQEAVQLKLSKLDTHIEAMTLERKVTVRDLTDISIRIRNFQRSVKNKVNDEEFKDAVLGAAAIRVELAPNDIDSKDVNFDPEAIQFVHIRPEWRVYPKIPLPHARPRWGRVARVWRGRGETGLCGSVVEGQFVGAEEEELKTCEMIDSLDGSNIISRLGEKSVVKSPVSAVSSVTTAVASSVPASPPSGNLSPNCICPNHPTDHYMVDHHTICKAVPLVEDSSLKPSVSDQDQMLERKVFTKSLKDETLETSRVNKMGNADLGLVGVKPPSTVPSLQKKCEEAADTAKSVDAPVQAAGVGGDLQRFRERLRRRLVVVKNTRRCGQDEVK